MLGAISVIFLFIIMLLNIKLLDILETSTQYTKNLPLGVAIGSLFIYEIFTILPFTFNDVSFLSSFLNLLTTLNELFLNSNVSFLSTVFLTYNPNVFDSNFINFSQIQAIGHNLYTFGAILLIITSIILLLAMVAPILISKNTKKF
jgi:NADH-ubiquinone oxidoreductase chain 6